MTFTLSNLWVYQIHKSIGITLLTLVVIRLIWHWISPPPLAIPSTPWQDRAAKAVHIALYALPRSLVMRKQYGAAPRRWHPHPVR